MDHGAERPKVENMKFQVRIDIELSPEGIASVEGVTIASNLGTPVEPPTDLLGPVPEKPAGRSPLDQDLTDLIDFFREHPDRPSVYVPKWDKDKAHLRPYLQAKGKARVREMLDAFVMRLGWPWDQNFNAACIRQAPLTIQGFVGIADRLDVLMEWESTEVPHRG